MYHYHYSLQWKIKSAVLSTKMLLILHTELITLTLSLWYCLTAMNEYGVQK